MAAWSKAWVCGRWLAGIVGSKPAENVDVCRERFVLSGSPVSLVQKSPTEYGVSECDREA